MSIAKDVNAYVLEHQYIKKGLKNSILNYSKLARTIIKDLSLKNSDFDAIVVSLRRLNYSMRKETSQEEGIRKLLSKSSLEIKNKIMVAIINKNIHLSLLLNLQKDMERLKSEITIIESTSAIIIICSEDNEKIIERYFKHNIIKSLKKLIAVTIKSSGEIEKTPGVVNYLCALFAQESVNIVEMMSCWTDTIFIIEEKDLQKIMKILSF